MCMALPKIVVEVEGNTPAVFIVRKAHGDVLKGGLHGCGRNCIPGQKTSRRDHAYTAFSISTCIESELHNEAKLVKLELTELVKHECASDKTFRSLGCQCC